MLPMPTMTRKLKRKALLAFLVFSPFVSHAADPDANAPDQSAKDIQWGVHVNTGRYVGEFGLKDHYGPWLGYGLGVHRQSNNGDRSKLLYTDFNYHKANTLYFSPGKQTPDKQFAVESFLVVNVGMDYQWLLTGDWQKGSYVGLGGALSLAQWKEVEADNGPGGGRGGYLGPQVSGKLGTRFNRNFGAEMRLSLARYAHITAPAVHVTLSFRR